MGGREDEPDDEIVVVFPFATLTLVSGSNLERDGQVTKVTNFLRSAPRPPSQILKCEVSGCG